MISTLIFEAAGPVFMALMIVIPVVAFVGRSGGPAPRWLAPVAVAASYVVGHLAVRGVPYLPPLEVFDWHPIFIAGAVVWEVMERRWRGVRWARPVVWLAVPSIILSPLLQHVWGGVGGSLRVVVVGLGLASSWWAIQRMGTTLGDAAAMAILAASTAVLAVLLAMSGTTSTAQLTGALASPLLVLALTAVWVELPIVLLAAPFIMVAAPLWMEGVWFARLELGPALLLWMAVVGPGVVCWRSGTRRWAWASGLVPLGLAVIWVIVQTRWATEPASPW